MKGWKGKMIYRKTYMDKILPFIGRPIIKVLTGVRRSGKSTILQMIREELTDRNIKVAQILFYRLDSLEYEDIKTSKELYKELKEHLYPDGKTYIFFDEIQEVESWEKVVNSLMTDFDVDFYATGSNSRLMSSEISTCLTGRYVSFRIYPLRFSEYLLFRDTYTKREDNKAEFARYLRYGGFPAIHLVDYTQDEAYTIIRDIYNSTIYTDIVKRNEIRKTDQLERVVKYTFDNVGRTFSANTLSRYIKSQDRKLDVETVYNYLEKLEKAYIVHRCSRYDIKGKGYLKTQEKFYLADPALRHAVLGYDPDSVAALMENVIYLELRARGYEVGVGKLDAAEVDFVAFKPEGKIYIQVTYEINNRETEKREYERLLSIKDNYPKYVIRMDDFAGGNYEGVKTMHIADFLLDDSY